MNGIPPIFTIGHSTQTIDEFLHLLSSNGVAAIADVRSTPASKFSPQFNRDALKRSLSTIGVGYVFLGRELGARSSDEDAYVDGKVQYRKLAAAPDFGSALDRLITGARTQTIAIMCSEREPLDCHRTILVSNELAKRGVNVEHILADGTCEPHDTSMLRLMQSFDLAEEDLLFSQAERLAEALRRQEDKIAYIQNGWEQS